MSRAAWRVKPLRTPWRAIVGAVQLARTLAADASALFARNLANFLIAFWDKEKARRFCRRG